MSPASYRAAPPRGTWSSLSRPRGARSGPRRRGPGSTAGRGDRALDGLLHAGVGLRRAHEVVPLVGGRAVGERLPVVLQRLAERRLVHLAARRPGAGILGARIL